MSEKNYMAYGDAETVLTGYANRIKKSPTTFVGTQAQWNALTAEQKAIYTLVNLTDDGETGSENAYTTSEQKTGEVWIDGKPIYRKVFQSTNCPSDSDVLLSNVDTVVNAYGYQTYRNSIKYHYPYTAGDSYLRWELYLNTHQVKAAINYDTSIVSNCHWIFEYTKTTD